MVLKKDVPRSRFRNWVRGWQDAVFGGMILTSLVGLIYAFTRR
jgi:hypothetical protein